MSKLEDFKKFDTESFIKSLRKMRKREGILTEKLLSISELPAVNNKTGVRGSDISNPTSNQALKRLAIKAELEEIQECKNAYDYALSRLSKDEAELIKGFFEPQIPIWQFVSSFGKKHYMGSTLVYKMRNETLDKMGAIIERYLEI